MFEKEKVRPDKKVLKAKKRKIKKDGKEAFCMEPPKKKSRKWLIIPVVLIVLVLLAVMIARDNGNIYVNRVTIEHKQLPEEFDGFRILQITDLHGEYFGNMQSRLVDIIKGLEYDIILFTGDYLSAPEDDDWWCVLDIVDGLKKAGAKEVPMYYILGERDYAYQGSGEPPTGWNMCIEPAKKTILMEELENRGLVFVYPIQEIKRENASIYLTGIKYDEKEFDKYGFDTDKHFSICVTHKPINYNVNLRLETANANRLTEVDYDVSISGHTLGGVYRLPILGTLYMEEIGILPQEKYTYGQHQTQGRVNFISSGLGNGPDAFFRMCNTPEVALITLKTVAE